MFKHAIAAAIGLTATISAATADPIPLPAPLHIPALDVQAPELSALNGPSFARLVQMCASMGFDCSAPVAGEETPYFDAYGLSEAALADAEKRMALHAEAWEQYQLDQPGQVALLPHPGLPYPLSFLGWTAPRVPPYPTIDPSQFGHRFPSVPRIQVTPGYSFPRGALSLHGFSHGGLSHDAIRTNPVFPWPSL